MLDFRLQVFYTVAKRLNFTKAAKELYISQPAVSKHIKELEAHFKNRLFERTSNRKISLSPAGQILLSYAEQILHVYKSLDYDMHLLAQQHTGLLRLGASSTVAQYILPVILAKFHQKFKDIQIQLLTGNTEDIEQALIRKEIDFGIIEGLSKNAAIQYSPFLRDEIVLVAAGTNYQIQKDQIKAEEIKNYPLLLREPGSGTLDVIIHALKPFQIKLADLNIEMRLGSTESIKSYLLHSDCLAFLSIHAILKELKNVACRVIDIKGLSIERPFHFIQTHGQHDAVVDLFKRFAISYSEKDLYREKDLYSKK